MLNPESRRVACGGRLAAPIGPVTSGKSTENEYESEYFSQSANSPAQGLSLEPPFVRGDVRFVELCFVLFVLWRHPGGVPSSSSSYDFSGGFLCTQDTKVSSKYRQKTRNSPALCIDPRLVALSVRFADFYCCCLPCPRSTGRVYCGHYQIASDRNLWFRQKSRTIP